MEVGRIHIFMLLGVRLSAVVAWYMIHTFDGVYDKAGAFIPWDDYHHYPNQVRDWPSMYVPPPLPEFVNGSAFKVPLITESPDYRLPEVENIARAHYYHESGRYYRLNPRHLGRWRYYRYWEQPERMLCYCVTVYKRYIPLGMGAVISYRHILTTAMSTDLILKRYRHKKTLENILGAWYNSDTLLHHHTNSVYYMTPARILYHPKWNPPEHTNRSHPLPCMYDIALWSSTKRFFHNTIFWTLAYAGLSPYAGLVTAICNRWSNSYGTPQAPFPLPSDKYNIVGCQMIMDMSRKPFPWFKYAIRFHGGLIYPCPKSDWDWFMCAKSYGPNLRFGVEPGGILHIADESGYRHIGVAGLNSFSMKLRSDHLMNYFTILDRHPVLDFIYEGVKGHLDPEYIDFRFENIWNKGIVLKQDGQWVIDSWQEPVDYNRFTTCQISDPKQCRSTSYDPIYYK